MLRHFIRAHVEVEQQPAPLAAVDELRVTREHVEMLFSGRWKDLCATILAGAAVGRCIR